MSDLNPLDFKLLFESSPDYYIIVKPNPPDFTIVAMTDSFLKVSQTSRERIVGERLFDMFPINPEEPGADGRRNLSLSLNRVVEKKISDSMAVQKYDIPRSPSDGGGYEERYWSTSNTPVFKNGELLYILHRTEDVTELIKAKGQLQDTELFDRLETEIILRAKQIQEANEKLHDAIQLREDVLAIVSHDLKNPLGSIEMSSDLLKDHLQKKPDPEAMSFIEIIDRSVRHMKRLIGDLLSFAKIQSGNLTIEVSKVPLEKLISEGLESVQHHAFKKQITISKEVNSSLSSIHCDHDRILEVISNILGNAIKFSPPQSTVLFSIKEVGNHLQFSIKDNGPGILPEHLPHLFDRY